MNTLAKASLGIVAAALLIAVPAGPVASESTPTTTTPVRFGMDAGSIAMQSAAGAKPDYGTLWIGPWTLNSGWGGPDGQLDAMRNAGVTPAIHHYYWGDDISRSCLENGCWSDLHNAQKDKAGWQRLTDELVQHLNSRMQGKPVVIFLETEFNKGDVANYEPLDGYLAEKAAQIKKGYPNAQVVMSLGNWNSAAWGTFDRTAAASDYVGIQGMRGSTRHSATEYATLYEGLLSGAKTLQSKFGKPVFIQDVALSTYPEPDYLNRQADELGQVFSELGALKAAGVQAVVYRSWRDSPNMDTANWFGEAERHWGLAWRDGTQKAGAQVWVDGVKAERASAAPAGSSGTATTSPGTSSSGAPYAASFQRGSGSNEWWVEAYVTASPAPAKVEAKAGDGAWRTLSHRSWGAYAESFNVPQGTPVTFKATAADGRTATSATEPWLGPAPSGTSSTSQSQTATPAPAPSPPPNQPPTAAFSAKANGLAVAVDGTASRDADGDALSYAWSFGDGSAGSGAHASRTYGKAGTYTVTLTVSDGKASATAKATVAVSEPYRATFTTGSGANAHWVEVKVGATPTPTKVEVKAGDGPWKALRLRSTGSTATTWGESIAIAKGTPVQFRGTAPDGQAATTPTMAWLGTASATGTASGSATATPSSSTPSTTSATSTTAASTTTTAATAFSAKFTPRSVGNDWWVETSVSANQGIAKVQAKVGSNGAWTDLPPTAWGTYAKSVHVKDGSYVQFRAVSASGATATSPTFVW